MNRSLADPVVAHPSDRQRRLAILARVGRTLCDTAEPSVIAAIGAEAASALFGSAAAGVQIHPHQGEAGAVAQANMNGQATAPAPDANDAAWIEGLGDGVVKAAILAEARKAGRLAVAVGDEVARDEAQWLIDALAAQLGAALARLDRGEQVRASLAAAVEQGLGDGESRRQTFSTMGHDFRSPLASLQIGCDMLTRVLKDQLTPDLRDILQAMRAAAKQATGMADNLVELFRMLHGVSRVRPAVVELEPILQKAADNVADRASEADVTVHRAGVTPDTVFADGERLTRVLSNLLENAVDFTPTGKRVTLTTNVSDDQVQIIVSDEGPGIAAEERPAVFQPFYEGRTAHGQKPGLGVGLAVGRVLVRHMNGDLTVASDPGAGAAFTITLPAG